MNTISRKNYTIVTDTETCNLIKSDRVIRKNNLTYDIGFALVEIATGKIILRRSYVVREIFFGEQDRMQSSYYAAKLPQYYRDIAEGKRKVAGLCDILNEINRLTKEYNVVSITAHNAAFDVDALNTTLNYLYGWDCVRALPQNVEIWDTMKMWRAVMPKKYAAFCENNQYMTAHNPPRVRLTAEIIYRFLTGDNDFVENHTGLEDVEIEAEILLACYKTHKKMAAERVLYHSKE